MVCHSWRVLILYNTTPSDKYEVSAINMIEIGEGNWKKLNSCFFRMHKRSSGGVTSLDEIHSCKLWQRQILLSFMKGKRLVVMFKRQSTMGRREMSLHKIKSFASDNKTRMSQERQLKNVDKRE